MAVSVEARLVKGNDRAEARKALYGAEGGDPIGRAYVRGLLGEGDQAKYRKDIARKFARIYSRVYARPYRCALNDNPRGATNDADSDFAFEQERWMKDNRALIDPADAVFFDQLVLPASPLDDPHWMAALLDGVEGLNRASRQMLNMALRGIDALQHRPPERANKTLDFTG